MKFHGITLEQGSAITNMTIASGTSFPSLPDEGELFFRSDADITIKGMYLYIGGGWLKVANPYAVTIPKGATLPVAGVEGDLFYLNSNTETEGLYLFKDSSWVNITSGSAPSFTITGDVSGTIDGGTDALTLAMVNSNVGSFGSATQAGTFTVNAKGLITAAGSTTITPAWSSITSTPTTLTGYGITDAQPLDADLTSIAGLAGTSGFLKKTATNTWTLDTNTYLTANQTITLSGDISGSGSTSITTTLANSGVTAGTYRSVTVDVKGRVTAGTNPTTLSGYGITDAQPLDADLTSIAGLAGTSGFLKKTAVDTWALDTNTYLTANQSITLSGDISGSGTTAITATLANSGVSAGTYRSVTVDVKGRVTAGTNPTTLAGYGITDAVAKAGDLMTGALGIIAGTAAAPGLYFSGDVNTGIFSPGAETVAVAANGAETARFTTSGLLVGLTSTVTGTSAGTAKIQATGVANYLAHYAADSANPAIFTFAKARAGGVAVDTANGGIGEIRFDGWDGASWIRSAMIASSVDGTVSTGNIPSLIRFATMPAGGALTERFRIASTGAWGVNGASYGSSGQVLTSNGSTASPTWQTPTTGTVTSVAATAPAAGITISGSPITSNGTLTFALANDLSAVESLSGTGIAVRTATDAWTTRSIAVSGTGLSITNADAVAGNPTITSNATSANTASTIVARDASGNFSAGTITAALSGNATTATSISDAPQLAQATTVTAVNNTTQTAVSTIAAASARTVKYLAQIHDTTNSHYHAVEILVIHNGTTVWKTEYAEVVSNAALGTFDADISGGNVRLLFTATATSNKNVTVYRTSLAV